jgi:FkbM family methyltransferase
VTASATTFSNVRITDAAIHLWRRMPVRGPGRFIKPLLRWEQARAGLRAPLGDATAVVSVENPPELALLLWGFYEDDVVTTINLGLRRGATAIDVGANCGIITLAMCLAVGPRGCVLAVDPSPAAIGRVEKQVEANGFSNVTLACVALGDRSGCDQYFPAAVGIGALPAVDREFVMANPLDVRIETLDNLVKELGLQLIELVKIDSDGSEVSILYGARETLQTHRPLLVLELYPDGLERRGFDAGDVATILREVGYELLQPELENTRRWQARPPRLTGFTQLALNDVGRGPRSSRNLVALHRENPGHGDLYRRLVEYRAPDRRYPLRSQ